MSRLIPNPGCPPGKQRPQEDGVRARGTSGEDAARASRTLPGTPFPAVPAPCATCAGIGFLDSPAGLVPCACQPDENRWRAARIPGRYFSAPSSLLARDELEASRYLWGPPGHGKTTQAVGILKRWARVRTSVYFVDLPDLELRRRRAVETGEDIGAEYLSAAFLVADDLCRQPRLTAYWEEYISNLIRERYNFKRPTIWTSNYSLEYAERMLGQSSVSRIKEMCGDRVEKVKARDWRLV